MRCSLTKFNSSFNFLLWAPPLDHLVRQFRRSRLSRPLLPRPVLLALPLLILG